MTTDMSSEETRPPPQAVNSAPTAASHGCERSLQLVDDAPITFTQHAGGATLRWSVTEVDASAVPGSRGVRCLIFARDDCIRRVWNYPAHWRTLDDAGLAALSWNR